MPASVVVGVWRYKLLVLEGGSRHALICQAASQAQHADPPPPPPAASAQPKSTSMPLHASSFTGAIKKHSAVVRKRLQHAMDDAWGEYQACRCEQCCSMVHISLLTALALFARAQHGHHDAQQCVHCSLNSRVKHHPRFVAFMLPAAL